MIHRGKEYRPGFIPEEVYEDYIDIAYGRGEDLRNTLLWIRLPRRVREVAGVRLRREVPSVPGNVR